jgi:hypothetical protein
MSFSKLENSLGPKKKITILKSPFHFCSVYLNIANSNFNSFILIFDA